MRCRVDDRSVRGASPAAAMSTPPTAPRCYAMLAVWFDRVRPGLLLYGIVPPPLASTHYADAGDDALSRVVAVKGMRAGEGVGYGARFTADAPRRSPLCRPGTPTVWTFGWPGAATS